VLVLSSLDYPESNVTMNIFGKPGGETARVVKYVSMDLLGLARTVI
jgi:hypothetical protein